MIRHVPLKLALRFVREHHRHRPRLQGGIIAIGLHEDGRLIGVAILGRGERLDPPDMITVTRVCTLGDRNACSKLYAHAKRVGQMLGYRRVKTFTELEECGASLRAVGATDDGTTKGGKRSRVGRPRNDERTEPKRRWFL